MPEPEEWGPEDFDGTVPPDDMPAWAPQFAGFLLYLRPVDRNGLILSCKFCDLGLYMTLAQAKRPEPTILLNLARHGMEHAVNGLVDHYACLGVTPKP